MTETAPATSRLWVELADPGDPSETPQRYRCDLTWLTSRWTCIFGRGCHGIDLERPDDGCCTLGAHLTDDADVERVRAVAERLGPDEWQYHDLGQGDAWLARQVVAAAPGEGAGGVDVEATTARVDGACIFLNRPGFPAGAGCALHTHALAEGLPPHTVKPDVCWQLPIRRDYREVALPDGTEYLEITLTEYDRRSWGPGGHQLDWYCSASPEAHCAPRPLYLTNREELVELMGRPAYELLAQRCDALVAAAEAAGATGPHGTPGRPGTAARSSAPGPERGDRPLLDLLVHPATRAAWSG